MPLRLLLIQFLVCYSLSANTLDYVVGSVDNVAITEGDLKAKASLLPGVSFKSVKSTPEIAQKLLEQVIFDKLVEAEAGKHNNEISPDDIDHFLSQIADSNNISVQEFIHIQKANTGLSEKQIKEQLKNELKKQKLAARLFQNSVHVSNQEVSDYLKKNTQLTSKGNKIKLRQIFLRFADKGKKKTKKLAHKIMQKLTPDNFADFAKKYSNSPDAQEGGFLGFLLEEDLSPDFFDALLTVSPGNISQPVETTTGIHIFKIEERISGLGKDKEKIETIIRNQLKQEKMEAKLKKFFADEIYERHVVERNI